MLSLLAIPGLPALLAVLPFITIPDGHLGPLPLHPFGFLVATGILLGHRIASHRGQVLGLDEQKFESVVFGTVGIGILLSHVFDTIAYHPEVLLERPWELIMFWRGLSSFGGFFGAALGFWFLTKHYHVDRWKAADAIAYGLPVGWLFGRMGCATVHDHPGLVSNHALAVNYPPPGVEYSELTKVLGIFRVNPVGAPGLPRFDLGVLEFALTPILIALVFIVGAKTRRRGMVVGWLAVVYPFLRFPLDFLRAGAGENGDVRYFGLTPGHYASIALLGLGIVILLRARSLPDDEAPKAPRSGTKPSQSATAATR